MFHPPGFTYVVTMLVLVLGAINGQNNLLFMLFGLAVGGLLISGVLSGANLMGVRVQRQTATPARAGEDVTVRYVITNTNRWLPAMGLVVEELDGIVTPQLTARRKVNIMFARAMAYVRAALTGKPVSTLLPTGQPSPNSFATAGAVVGPVVGHVLCVPPRGKVLCEASGPGLERGVTKLRRFRVSSTFPFGVTRKSVMFEHVQEVEVYPPRREVLRAPRPAGVGLRVAASSGRVSRQGEEFFALREFTSGDSPRSVAWKPSARRGTLVVKEQTRPVSHDYIFEIPGPEPSPQSNIHAEEALARAVALAIFTLQRQPGSSAGIQVLAGDGSRRTLATRERSSGAILSAAARWQWGGGQVNSVSPVNRGVLRIPVGPEDTYYFAPQPTAHAPEVDKVAQGVP
jgi:uncharacterized protein (DUF58 family)